MPNAPKTPARTVRVDDDLWAAITAEAADRGETVSDAVRQWGRRYAKNKMAR